MVVCGIALFTVIFLPIWRIDLDAPQYPEGLNLYIHADGLAGNVDIINGLNHYIGMKTLHNDDFIEFKILPYLIGFFSLLILAVAAAGRRWLLNTTLILFIIFGIVAMVDFWLWEYDYGHNLDPNAAIKVPGMAYQPPLIGFKQLLNFGAYSIPAMGGWIFIAVGGGLLLTSIAEWKAKRKAGTSVNFAAGSSALAGLLFVMMFTSCNTGPEPIQTGIDNCAFCKMTVSDTKFASELITKKGRVYKFDDLHCMLSFAGASEMNKNDIKSYYFSDFNNPAQLINAEQAFFLQSDQLKGPMGGNIAAFSDVAGRKQFVEHFPGKLLNWNEILNDPGSEKEPHEHSDHAH